MRVRPGLVRLSENVEQERVHVVVEGLVVKEELRQQAQVLAVDLVFQPIHFKHRNRGVKPVRRMRISVRQCLGATERPVRSVNLIPRRMPQVALRAVAQQRLHLPHVLEAEFTHENLLRSCRNAREGGVVPCVHLVVPELDHVDVPDFGFLLVLPLQRLVPSRQLADALREVQSVLQHSLVFPRDARLRRGAQQVHSVPARRKQWLGLGSCGWAVRRNSIGWYPFVEALVQVIIVHIVVKPCRKRASFDNSCCSLLVVKASLTEHSNPYIKSCALNPRQFSVQFISCRTFETF
mmetsp:Transcript_3026/g.7087  ORF Transcript_3026/g.7087 Transcript_3026/m.7087 type:complete len:293 (-) Transcript_3026:526-1404(-)